MSGGRIVYGTGLPLYPGFNCVTGPVGMNLQPGLSPTPLANSAACCIPNPLFLNSSTRLVGVGVEIVNTTAELYKQGSVTCVRVPCIEIEGYAGLPFDVLKKSDHVEPEHKTNSKDLKSLQEESKKVVSLKGKDKTRWTVDTDDHDFHGENSSMITYAPLPVTFAQFPPSTLNLMTVYPGSVTWAAKDGVYMVPVMNSIKNPFLWNAPNQYAITTNQGLPYTGNVGGYFNYNDAGTEGLATSRSLPFDTSIAYFGNLSYTSTLQMTVRYFFETVPDIVVNPSMIPLMKCPTPYDPMIMEIYSRVTEKTLVAVPVGENPLGEWFNDILKVVGDYAPAVGFGVGTALGNPMLGSQIGSAVSSAARMLQPAVERSIKVTASNPGSDGKARVNQKRPVRLIERRTDSISDSEYQAMVRANRARLMSGAPKKGSKKQGKNKRASRNIGSRNRNKGRG
jgi:hypothetical protein